MVLVFAPLFLNGASDKLFSLHRPPFWVLIMGGLWSEKSLSDAPFRNARAKTKTIHSSERPYCQAPKATTQGDKNYQHTNVCFGIGLVSCLGHMLN